LVLNENVLDSGHSIPKFDTPTFPKEFSQAVIKLVGRYLLAIKVGRRVPIDEELIDLFIGSIKRI
jgi:hypothetical protein